MAKQNLVFLYGRLHKPAQIAKSGDEYKYGMIYLDTVRSLRSAHDGLKFTKHDIPLIFSKEVDIIKQMEECEVNDTVFIKGVITSKQIPKKTFCPTEDCKDEKGQQTVNQVNGSLLYVTPIYMEKRNSHNTKDEAIEDVLEHREISNQAFVYGTVVANPKIIKTARGLKITQYPIAINRKFTIRTDEPEIRTDYPFVKSYGDQAIEDKLRLTIGSEVLVDGVLQARTVTRKTKCPICGKIYDWKDRAMELVPYEMEYISNYLTDEQIENDKASTAEALRNEIASGLFIDEDVEGLSVE